MKKPETGEFNSYYKTYIDLCSDGDFLTLYQENAHFVNQFFSEIPADRHDYRYAEGKWTIKQMLMHLIDTERIFLYRALVAIRNDQHAGLQSYDEDHYAAQADVSKRSMQSLLDEFEVVRKSGEFLFNNCSDQESKTCVSVFGNQTSARAIGYVLIGHTIHHMKIIRERYLN